MEIDLTKTPAQLADDWCDIWRVEGNAPRKDLAVFIAQLHYQAHKAGAAETQAKADIRAEVNFQVGLKAGRTLMIGEIVETLIKKQQEEEAK